MSQSEWEKSNVLFQADDKAGTLARYSKNLNLSKLKTRISLWAFLYFYRTVLLISWPGVTIYTIYDLY